MTGSQFPESVSRPITRRRLLVAGAGSLAALAVYSGEVARHHIDVTWHDVLLPGLPDAFEGFRIVQISDIHLEEFTEPSFLRAVIHRVNNLRPDVVLNTGDFVTSGLAPNKSAVAAGWRCAELLDQLACKQRYAVLGNHDYMVGAEPVYEALTTHSVTVLRNSCVPLERAGGRIWLSGLTDCLQSMTYPDAAIPMQIRHVANEPIIFMCHAPDYVDHLVSIAAGQAVALMLSGHTHGGQVRLPLAGPLILPDGGHKYVQGWFRFGSLQLHVNRGLGAVRVPFRLNCPPEISVLTLRRERGQPDASRNFPDVEGSLSPEPSAAHRA